MEGSTYQSGLFSLSTSPGPNAAEPRAISYAATVNVAIIRFVIEGYSLLSTSII